MTFYQQLALICVGAAVNLLLSMYLLRWRKRQDTPEDLAWRIGRLEDAFIAHTGITLNGKPFKKEH